MKKLPKPLNRYGYPSSQLIEIITLLDLNSEEFFNALGTNTCVLSNKEEVVYYPCDVENALYKLGHKLGKYTKWD